MKQLVLHDWMDLAWLPWLCACIAERCACMVHEFEVQDVAAGGERGRGLSHDLISQPVKRIMVECAPSEIAFMAGASSMPCSSPNHKVRMLAQHHRLCDSARPFNSLSNVRNDSDLVGKPAAGPSFKH